MSGGNADVEHVEAGQPQVSILTVGYNSRAYLGRCIEALGEAARQTPVEMLFVDNGTDGSKQQIARSFPWVRILPGKGNIGFGRACNYLAEHAKGQWLLLLNPDTEARPGSVDCLAGAARAHPEYDILGAITVISRDGSAAMAVMELPGIASLARGLIGRAARPSPAHGDEPIVPVSCVSGGCLLISRNLWQELGGFDQEFFLYGEDIDLCKRVADRGGKLGLVRAAKIYHDIGSGDYFSPQRLHFQMRGNAQYFRKHFAWPHAWACIGMLWLSAWVRFVIGGAIGLQQERFRRMSRGFRAVALRPWSWMLGYAREAREHHLD